MVPNGLADHVLVFVFRPFYKGWIQPFAWFGTKGGASGTVLVELVTKNIARLFQAGAIKKASVCDGFSTNKKLYSHFGVSGTED
jgi:hypothetical protein